MKFILMIAENKREMYLSGICRNFIDQYRELKKVKAATFTSVGKVDKKLQKKIEQTIAKWFSCDVELSVEQDESLLGGFILRVGDKQVDASVASKLKRIERELINTTV